MAKFRWQTVRIALLATLLVASLGALARAAFGPNPNEIKAAGENYDFPATVPLAAWQQVSTQSLAATNEEIPNPGQRYQYRQNGQQLAVEVRYERYTDSNISRLINIYTSLQPGLLSLQGKRQEGIGYYALFTDEERAYLSACLNPIGETTITEQQFVQNRYRHGLSARGVLLWAIGQQDLLDGRCFWTLMSLPVAADADSVALTEAYQTLELAWSDWYRWWQSQWR